MSVRRLAGFLASPTLAMVGASACGLIAGVDEDPYLYGDAAPPAPQNDGETPVDAGVGTNDARVGGDPSNLPECTAQRLVHVVDGLGGLANHTLVWPVPAVIDGFMQGLGYAYDDPARVKSVGISAAHPLYARRVGARAVWEGLGTHPMPTVLVAGETEVHAAMPLSTTRLGPHDFTRRAASLQASLAATWPVVAIGSVRYEDEAGAPPAEFFPDVDAAIAGLAAGDADVTRELTPTPAELTPFNGDEAGLAATLFFAARAFRTGRVSTVLASGLNNDPHGMFAETANAAARADRLARLLDDFYADLARTLEPRCSRAGKTLSLADNTMLVISGDTPKAPFVRGGWPDKTPGDSNWIYVRANGYLKIGWFGEVRPEDGGRASYFDPLTGLPSTTVSSSEAADAALTAALPAVSRCDSSSVRKISSTSYDGLTAVP